jgi:hypothetical protein
MLVGEAVGVSLGVDVFVGTEVLVGIRMMDSGVSVGIAGVTVAGRVGERTGVRVGMLGT